MKICKTNKTNIYSNLLVILSVIFFILILFLSSFSYYFLNKNFYEKEYEKNNVYFQLGKENVMNITSNLFNFFEGKEELKYFTEKEKSHLEDVKVLYNAGYVIFYLSIALFLICLIFLFFICSEKCNLFAKKLSKIFIYSSLFSVIFIIILYIFRNNFDFMFELFHKVLFTGNWQFGREYLLINLFTEQFFYDIAFNIFLMSFIISIIILVLGLVLKFSLKKS